MLPAGGTDGWVDEVISTELLFPRNGTKLPFVGHALIYSAYEARTLTWDPLLGQFTLTNAAGTVLHTLARSGVISCDLAFDSLDRQFYCWLEANDQIWMYWFNSVSSAFEITNITSGENPCCAFDERRIILSSQADIYLFYQRDNLIFYRLQRDRYLVEYPVPDSIAAVELETCGMGTNSRMTLRVQLSDHVLFALGEKPMLIEGEYCGYPLGVNPWQRN